MKFNLKRYISSPDALKGGLLASLFGLLPTIGLGAEYLFINVTHGIDFATDGRLGEGRISGMISVLNINTLWLLNCLPFLGHKKWEAFLWLETLCTTSG